MNGAKKIDSLKKVKGKIEFLIDNFLGKIRFIYLFKQLWFMFLFFECFLENKH